MSKKHRKSTEKDKTKSTEKAQKNTRQKAQKKKQKTLNQPVITRRVQSLYKSVMKVFSYPRS